MKKLMEKVTNVKDSINSKIIGLQILGMTALATTTAGASQLDSDATTKAEGILDEIFKYLGIIFMVVGALMLFSGIMSYVMAYRDDDPEKKHKASMSIAAGVGVLVIGIAAATIVSNLISAATA